MLDFIRNFRSLTRWNRWVNRNFGFQPVGFDFFSEGEWEEEGEAELSFEGFDFFESEAALFIFGFSDFESEAAPLVFGFSDSAFFL